MQIRALIFDFDGLMLDTETVEYQSWQEIFHKFGAELPVEVWGQAVGRGFSEEFEPFSYLEGVLGHEVDRAALSAARTRRDRELLAGRPLLPGVEMYIRDARSMGMQVAIASSSTYEWVHSHLEPYGLQASFDAISTSDDVKHTKPHPDVFLAALNALDVESKEAIVLEDSPNGVLAAKRAGIFVVAIPNGVTMHLTFESPDVRMDSLADMSLSDLLHLALNNHHG